MQRNETGQRMKLHVDEFVRVVPGSNPLGSLDGYLNMLRGIWSQSDAFESTALIFIYSLLRQVHLF
jgi:hypothetical protein